MNRRLASALFALTALASVPSCSGGGARAPLHVELAPVLDCSRATNDLPPEIRLFTVQICPSAGGDCAALTDPGGDHGGGAPLLRIARTLDLRFTVDARLDPGTDYDVTIVAYAGPETGTCAPTAMGHANNVRFGRDEVGVRLYPLGGWSCAGVHVGGSETSVPRALHEAVLLPNDEVLILGGVAGPTAGAIVFSSGAAPQRAVEVFDPRDARFHAVSIRDEDGVEGFARVMFHARYISTDAQGRYEIHTYGGFDPSVLPATSGGMPGASIGFDGNGTLSAVSALFGPLAPMAMASTAGFRSDATILYDPATRSATVTSRGGTGYTATAASEGSGTIGVVRGIDTLTITSGVPVYGLTAGWYTDGGGHESTLMNDRLGSTITPLSATSFLIWGGHVATAMDAPLAAASVIPTAGELVTTTGTGSVAVAAHDPTVTPDDGRPFPTAYHTATRIAGPTGATSILFAGGATLAGSVSPLGPRMSFASPALTVARFGTDGSFAGGTRVTGRVETVLHTADPVDSTGARVLVVGGATLDGSSGQPTTFFGSNVTGTVDYDATGNAYSWHPAADLTVGRAGHTTTIIPGHGVLVVGGLSRTMSTVSMITSSELLLWEDLQGTARPASMSCSMATDAGTSGDAGRRDGGASDVGPARDTGASTDAAAATD